MARSAVLAAAVLLVVGCTAPLAEGTASPTATLPPPPVSPSSAPASPREAPTASPTADFSTPAPTPSAAPPAHRIDTREVGGRLVLFDTHAGEPFIARGVNILRKEFVGGRAYDTLFGDRYDEAWVDAELGRLAGLGYNTVRVFLDLCASDCIADPAGGLRASYLDHVADFLGRARDHGLVVIPASNDLPDTADYGNSVPCCDPFAGYRNSVYLSADGHAAAERYWRDIVGGLIERGAATDAVLGWQLVNEQFTFLDLPPLSLSSGTVTTGDGETWDMADAAQRPAMVESNVVAFVDRLAGAIREIDPTGLVTIGFFAPNEPLEWRPGDNRLVLTRAVLERSSLDFADLHAYPGGGLDVQEYLVQFGVTDAVRMPLIMGELGAFKHSYASPAQGAEALVAWQAASCANFQGWLLWLAAPTDEEVWTGTEGEGVIDRALSPAERPDACAEGGWVRRNLALDAQVRSSAALRAEPPEYAVDGAPDTQWGAGDHPPQWIEIDLGAAHDVASIELLVGQFPAGPTEHRVFAGSRRAGMTRVETLRGRTRDGDVLTVELDGGPGEAIRFVRIETVSSPSWVSWREVRVFAR